MRKKYIVKSAKSFLNENSCLCKNCAPIKSPEQLQVNSENIAQRLLDVDNTYIYKSGFNGMKGKIKVFHTTCGNVIEFSPKYFFGVKKRRCNICANKIRGNNNRKENYLETVLNSQPHGKEYEWLESYEGKENKSILGIKHLTCGHEYKVRPNDFQQGYLCPNCTTSAMPKVSRNVKRIESYLRESYIPFEREKTFEGMKYKNRLYIDFCITLRNNHFLLIEYDGIQHFKDDETRLIVRQARDKAKNDYCSERKNLHLHRIAYNEPLFERLKEIINAYKERIIFTEEKEKPIKMKSPFSLNRLKLKNKK